MWRAAYEVLSDSQKRRIYDVHGEDGVKQHSAGGGGGGGNSAQDIFSQCVALAHTSACMRIAIASPDDTHLAQLPGSSAVSAASEVSGATAENQRLPRGRR